MNEKYNYEWRSIPEVSYIEVTRDGEVRYQKGKERYDEHGTLINPLRYLKDARGNAKSIQQIITKAFPDIPMRYPQQW